MGIHAEKRVDHNLIHMKEMIRNISEIENIPEEDVVYHALWLVNMEANERKVHRDLRQAFKEIEEGKVKSLGSFAKYLNEDV